MDECSLFFGRVGWGLAVVAVVLMLVLAGGDGGVCGRDNFMGMITMGRHAT